MKSAPSCAVAIVLVGSSACGQLNGFDVFVDHEVSPGHPSTEVEIWAHFDSQYFAFAYSAFAVRTTQEYWVDQGTWSNFECVLDGYNSSPGTISDDGSDVVGALPGQLHEHPMAADDSNPILVWRGTWTTADFSIRQIEVGTATLWFDVYVEDDWWAPERKDVRGENFGGASGFISVVPAPGPAALGLGCSALAMIRQRRRG